MGEATGPISGQPPKIPDSTKAAIINAAESEATGSHAPGEKVKSEKELERERKKAEKQAKFEQKKKAQATAAPPETSKNKEKKAKAEKKSEEEVLPAYVEDTPAGEKKCMICFMVTFLCH